MLQRAFPLAIILLAGTCPLEAAGQAAPIQYGVCASQFNLPTIYVSGVLQGPASSAASLRAGFTQFLAQRYGYKGAIGCAPAANTAAAEKLTQERVSALRNAKKIVIETGWTENAAPAAKLAGMLNNLPSTPQGSGAAAASTPEAGSAGTAAAGTTSAARRGGASGTTGTSSGSAGSSEWAGVLASIFGGGGSGTGSNSGSSSGGSGGCASGAGAKSQTGAAGSGGSNSGDAGSGGCQSTISQVSSALSSAFAQKPASSGSAAHAAADGLGSAQAQKTRLVVYGCGRQDTQVACVTDLTNQNQADTLVQSADLWKDTFIVDDRGDRHPRSRGFFLNIDGDQRTQLDISYGKSARFILMFDDVQPKVQKVSLRSPSGPLDVEDIALITSGSPSDASH